MSKYSEELKSKVIRLHLQEGRSQSSLEKEFNIGRGSIYYWLKSYNKECQNNPSKAQEKQGDCPKIKKKGIENAALHLSTSNKNAAT